MSSFVNMYSDNDNEISDSTPMVALEKLPVFFVYVRQGGDILKVVQERVFLEMDDEEGGSFISKQRLVDWVSQRRFVDLGDGIVANFRLDDILLFHFLDLSTLEEGFLQGFSILEDIELEESLQQFHDLSALYLFFNETTGTMSGKKKPPLKILEGVVDGMEGVSMKGSGSGVVVVDVDPAHRGTRRFRHRGGAGGGFTRRITIK